MAELVDGRTTSGLLLDSFSASVRQVHVSINHQPHTQLVRGYTHMYKGGECSFRVGEGGGGGLGLKNKSQYRSEDMLPQEFLTFRERSEAF